MTIKEETNHQNPPNKEKPRFRWHHWWIVPNIFKKVLTPTLSKLFQKIEKKVEGKLLSEARITLIPKLNSDTTGKVTDQYSLYL